MSRSGLKNKPSAHTKPLVRAYGRGRNRGRRIVRLARTYALDRAIRGGVIEGVGITVHMPTSLRISYRLSRAASSMNAAHDPVRMSVAQDVVPHLCKRGCAC